MSLTDPSYWKELIYNKGPKYDKILEMIAAINANTTAPPAHKTSHQDGGTDEISVAALSGLLADSQNPLAHKASHQDGGGDEISVAALSGLLADGQNPLSHSNTAHSNALHDDVANEITSITLKSLPLPADEIIIEDSGASYVKKSTTRANILMTINDTLAYVEKFLPATERRVVYTSGTVNYSNIFNVAATTSLATSVGNIARWSWDITIPPGATTITGVYAYMRGNTTANHKLHFQDPDLEYSGAYTPSWNIKNTTVSWSGDNYIKRITLWTGTHDLSTNHSGHGTVRIFWETHGTSSNNTHIAGIWIRFA